MHWERVDGLALPRRVGGHAALDLCNTRAGWDSGPPDPRGEWLDSYAHLAGWTAYNELVDEATGRALKAEGERHPRQALRVLTEVRELRAAVHEAVLDPRHERGISAIERVAKHAAAAARLEAGRSPEWVIPVSVELPLLLAGQVAADLLTTVDLDAVRACPGAECGWLFIDAPGRRKWCSMQSCGNRAKVAAHAARHRVTKA